MLYDGRRVKQQLRRSRDHGGTRVPTPPTFESGQQLGKRENTVTDGGGCSKVKQVETGWREGGVLVGERLTGSTVSDKE